MEFFKKRKHLKRMPYERKKPKQVSPLRFYLGFYFPVVHFTLADAFFFGDDSFTLQTVFPNFPKNAYWRMKKLFSDAIIQKTTIGRDWYVLF